MTAAPAMKIKALAGWYGANRKLAAAVGAACGECAWVGVPFAGGCCELPHIKARAGVANDLHRHIINLARTVRDRALKDSLAERLAGTLFHPDELAAAQRRCVDREGQMRGGLFGVPRDPTDTEALEWAFDYFICCWMGRGGHAGKGAEFDQNLSVRWTSSGGGSAKRFQSAVESLEAWHTALCRFEFTAVDAFEFLDNCCDHMGHVIYCDAPWPDAGSEYKYAFTDDQQRRLAARLFCFRRAKVVIRYGDHPLIRELYPERLWTWNHQTSRDQANGEVPEVLIVSLPGAEGRGAG